MREGGIKDETYTCYDKLSKNENWNNWKNFEICNRIVRSKLLQIPQKTCDFILALKQAKKAARFGLSYINKPTKIACYKCVVPLLEVCLSAFDLPYTYTNTDIFTYNYNRRYQNHQIQMGENERWNLYVL